MFKLQKTNESSNIVQQMPPNYSNLNSENQDANRPPPSYTEAAHYPPVYQPYTFPKPSMGVEQPQQNITYPPYPQPQNFVHPTNTIPVGNTYIVNSAR